MPRDSIGSASGEDPLDRIRSWQMSSRWEHHERERSHSATGSQRDTGAKFTLLFYF